MKKMIKSIPSFQSEAEERAFWEKMIRLTILS